MPKIILITGATAGIGLATARELAGEGHDLVLHGRTVEKLRRAAREITDAHPAARLHTVSADLADQDDIRRMAQTVQRLVPRLDVLINNAGVWNSKQALTAAGHETTFAVNHLAYAYLGHLLMPALLRSGAPRIVCVASDSHKQIKGMFFDDLNLDHNYHGLRSYAQSKLANVLFCYEYERRRPSPEFPAIYAVQPGLVQTDIGLKGNTWLHRLAWRVRRRMSGHKSPAEGAATSVFLAADPAVQGQSGLYWDDLKPKKSYSSSYDPDEARILWEQTMEILGISDFFTPAG